MTNRLRNGSRALLRPGLAALLAMPTGAALPIGIDHLAFSGASIHASAAPAFQVSDGAGNADDPIERIFRQTRDVAVPQSEEDAPTGSESPFVVDKVAIADEALDALRGGFEFNDGNLKVSFGIERAVFVNGQLVASTVLSFKDLQWTAGAGTQPQQLPTGATGTIGLIQNGPGNAISARIDANLAGTIIQNTLNNQDIRNITTINASLNSGQLMRSVAIQSAVHNAIVDSMRR